MAVCMSVVKGAFGPPNLVLAIGTATSVQVRTTGGWGMLCFSVLVYMAANT